MDDVDMLADEEAQNAAIDAALKTHGFPTNDRCPRCHRYHEPMKHGEGWCNAERAPDEVPAR
jgi:hypothetical protein